MAGHNRDNLQKAKAEAFRAMHNASVMLVLPNVWDAVSAKIYEGEGFRAIATASSAVAATLGYADGEYMTAAQNLSVARRIVGVVDLPVSVDLERGYATTLEGVVESARGVIDAGAVGLNIEDGTGNASMPLFEQSEQVERICAIRAMAKESGVPLVINARTDVFLAMEGSRSDLLGHTVERANAYHAAGADCVFVPDMGQLDRTTVEDLVKEIDAPINLIAGSHLPSLPELEEIGIARVSFGPRAHRACLALLRRIAREWKATGTFNLMDADALTYAEVNGMFQGRRG
ncbi:MAG: isocitrate lyase/PEP mutase family protein [Planctomycetota bacterium]|jgi:2-methylisocitrate lyase-like PEP mutase family enzyme